MLPYIISAALLTEVVLTTKAKATPTLRGHRQMLTLSLPPDLVTKVDAEAAKQHRSRANMIEMILREGYDLAPQGETA